MKICINFVLSVFIAKVFCRDRTTVGDLPPDVAAELLSMMVKNLISSLGGCQKLRPSDFKLEVYTRNNLTLSTIINVKNPIEIDPDKELIVFIHGWIANKYRFVPEMKDAYLKRYDVNIITVDWAKLARRFYTTSVCYVPQLAEVVSDMLCLLEQKRPMTIGRTHIAGHSLGGHMAGFIGQYVMEKCGEQIGRITAMDPAGILYQYLPIDERLDKSDAKFVNVIHSNEGILGYWGNLGHVDFHVNCGTFQLGCPVIELSLESIINLPVALVTCDHSRSVDYLLHSLERPFLARSCRLCPIPCIPNIIFNRNKVIMGEDTPTNATGGYVIAILLR